MSRKSPRADDADLDAGGQHDLMDAKTQSDTRRGSPTGRAAHDGDGHDHHEHQHEQAEAGIDLPVFGHVEYKTVGFMAGLGVAGAVGVIEWPVVAAVGIAYALARRE